MKKAVPAKRKRDAAATSNAILEAASIVFSRSGYDRVGLREIAKEAGVTAALVNRYFGSKEGLFARILERKIDLAPVLAADRVAFGDWFAEYLVTKRENPNQYDPMLLMLRSLSDDDALKIIRATLEEQLSKPLTAWLGGDNASERAGLMIAMFSGFALMKDVVRIKNLRKADQDILITLLAPIIKIIADSPKSPEMG
ncbi:TetR/AcrR family transcriptional regulator [Mesorhizobium sp.]|uniref:TetR/AcrR family transcriptional regulator n=1 Tax=Mesorhizobium sp. TaxID=1871066 RepID=UPI0025DE8585|nr:TetR/AcrR family transcriptional regulator [Mesorhizobium sp.]